MRHHREVKNNLLLPPDKKPRPQRKPLPKDAPAWIRKWAKRIGG